MPRKKRELTEEEKARSKKVSKIHVWKPTEEEKIVDVDGKLFVCYFEKVFGFPEKLTVYDRFLIGKESYINFLDTIVKYINFFINNYDFDNELVSAYLKCKFAVDKEKVFTEREMDSYIDFIYEIMFTESMIEKIETLVEENYLDDIEAPSDKKAYVKKEKKHLESLEFTNQHVKILLSISFGMKIMCPVLFHYIQLNSIKIEKDSDIIFRFYHRLFKIFGYAKTWELCDMEGNIKEKDIPYETVLAFAKENEIPLTQIGTDKYYYFTNEEGEMMYYTKSVIDMYNKIYVYV